MLQSSVSFCLIWFAETATCQAEPDICGSTLRLLSLARDLWAVRYGRAIIGYEDIKARVLSVMNNGLSWTKMASGLSI
ncbi:uncharacterized protein BO66DRAFT_256391 [Aspergillus aculeatinus CBS 121060]|uniref:Uncharacterized protein n=1 Tax=Aspergillus aculeatinus CBS 121060 TaxID=1448322 RepID=A0ACD1GRQ2_9EURO|nr:hypothetical protein BO66DRAFT_256391 [Aspergillus aculeatinus CBS 121060]RAH64044.1 hypothetical protein BO66DRAFT_256391 [Aspergillus aculeatinus CBS 121060]